MQTLKSVLDRFMRLLPFLTTPNSYRRFRLELFYSYPDVWNDRHAQSSQAGPGKTQSGEREEGSSRCQPAPDKPARHAAQPAAVRAHIRPYLTWPELHESGSHRDMPLC